MTSMLWMPRLPTPIAMRDPGARRAAKLEALSCFSTSAGTSAMRRSGNFCRVTKRRGNRMIPILLLRLFLPLRFEHAGVLTRGIEGEAEASGIERGVRLQIHIAVIQRIGVFVVVAEELA